MQTLFKEHLTSRLTLIKKIMGRNNIDTLLIETGEPDYFFLDDQTMVFKPNPHFNYLCPQSGAGHLLKIDHNTQPTLYFYSPKDFWHEPSSLHKSFWSDCFHIRPFDNVDQLWSENIKVGHENATIISPHPDHALEMGCHEVSDTVLSELHALRVTKTDYEISCLKQANQSAALGHEAARNAFFEGRSEFEIFCQYLLATHHREIDLPYSPIIAFNEKSSVLHYQNLNISGHGESFLIDAGTKFNGYCSDITRTYCRQNAHPFFKDLITQIQLVQNDLCQMVNPGFDYYEIQQKTHEEITRILIESQIILCSRDEAKELKLSHIFFPHGVGHGLGLQVHDVGGKTKNVKDDLYPYLRTLRKIQINDVLTIEPGLYFIPILLDPAKSNPQLAKHLNWSLISELLPMGGIRIEDNVVATKDGPYNLTREFLNF